LQKNVPLFRILSLAGFEFSVERWDLKSGCCPETEVSEQLYSSLIFTEVGMKCLTKKIGALILSLAALLFAAACDKKTSAPATGSVGTAESVSAEGGGLSYPVSGNPKILISRKQDVDLPTGGYSSYNDTPGVKAWIEQTGINLEFVELVDATAYMLYLAGGNLADIIMGGKSFYPGGISKMNEDGLARDLTDLLPRYAPDYWARMNTTSQYLNGIRDADGKFYALAGNFTEIGSIYTSWTGLVARKEILDKLNTAPPETADELYQFLKRSRDELGVEIPFMSASFRFSTIFTGGSLTSPFGLPKADAYHIDGKVHFGSYDPQYKDVLAFFHKLYVEKLLDNNFAVTDEPTAHASMLSGNTALIFSAASRIQNMTIAANNAPDFTLIGLPSMSTAKGLTPMYSLADTPVRDAFWAFLPESCRDVENSLKLLNYLFTEEGNILANFGKENETFTWINNEPVLTDFVTNNPQGLSLDGILRTCGLMNFPSVQDDRMLRQRFGLPQQIQAMEAWSKSDVAKYRITNDSILGKYADEYSALVTDINTYIYECRAQFISGALPLDRFDSYIATLKRMGMDRLLEILQESYDVYNK
jgi:putative aldouronate transport system substrate-binding protein